MDCVKDQKQANMSTTKTLKREASGKMIDPSSPTKMKKTENGVVVTQ